MEPDESDSKHRRNCSIPEVSLKLDWMDTLVIMSNIVTVNKM